MSLAPLVTTADLEQRLGRTLTTEEAARCVGLLKDGSAAVRRFARQDFTHVVDDVATLRVRDGKVRLPQRPASRPTAITFRDELTDLLSAMSGWTWDGFDEVDLSYRSYVGNVSSRWGIRVHTVQVTYSHGYAEIPDDVVGVTCGIVLRALLGPGYETADVQSEGIDDFRQQFFERRSAGSPTLTEDDREILKVYRRAGGTVAFR